MTTQTPEPIFIDAHDVARILGLPDDLAFLRRRAELEDRHGFPLSLPYWKRPLKYRRDAVVAWLAEQGGPRPVGHPDIPPELLTSGKVSLLAEARRP